LWRDLCSIHNVSMVLLNGAAKGFKVWQEELLA
jgi:hypothetical protein